jgi:hypothetical protein
MADRALEDIVAEIEARNQRRNRENAVEGWIALAEDYFAKSGNPLCVWATIRYCDEKGVGLPGWVTTYLVKSAARVIEIAAGPAKTAPERCLDALGFRRPRGQESPFEDWYRWTRREPACLEFARRVCGGEALKKARYGTAATFNVAETTLDAWLREFFPGKGGKETWNEFFKHELDLEGPRYNKTLSALLGGSHFRRRITSAKSSTPV